MVFEKMNSPDFLHFDPHTANLVHYGRSFAGIKKYPPTWEYTHPGGLDQIVELRGLEPLTLTLPV
jgi:hypothetical protein